MTVNSLGKGKFRRRKSGLSCLILILVIELFCTTSQEQSLPSTLYYLNPDSPQGNLVQLKRTMDDFFAKANPPITFQPFAHLVDFEEQLKVNTPAFLFIPGWYLKNYGSELNLRPLITPVRKGINTYVINMASEIINR